MSWSPFPWSLGNDLCQLSAIEMRDAGCGMMQRDGSFATSKHRSTDPQIYDDVDALPDRARGVHVCVRRVGASEHYT
jgi:hypothetical protein